MASKPTFEKALTDLETIIDELEAGNLPLEKALKKFEQGVQLSKYCEHLLDETEKRISIIMKNSNGDEFKEIPFNNSEDETD